MTHPEAHNILQAIIAEPDNDLHRLAYADWCEENNQPERAEFIRLQIALWNEQRDCNCGSTQGGHTFRGGQHHNGPCAASQLRIEVNGKWVRADLIAMTLWSANRCKWVGIGENHHPLECLAANLGQYARGFIRKVECTHDAWIEHGKKICAEHPIEDVRLVDKTPVFYFGMYCYHSENAPFFHIEHGCLHPEIHKHLAGFTQTVGNDPDWKDYPTEVDAQIAVAKACIAYGRSP